MTIWFTSDLHLGHTNILKYCERPFKDTQEMDAAIICNWNSVVKPTDTVYILGDLGMKNPKYLAETIKTLHGTKYLIKGNHDHKILKDEELRNCFVWIKDYFVLNGIETDKESKIIVMSHFPMYQWDESHRGSIHIHGHSHGVLPKENIRRIDVGVDSMKFTPISLEHLTELVKDIPEQQLFKNLPGIKNGAIKE